MKKLNDLKLLYIARPLTTDSEYKVLSYIRDAVSYSTAKKKTPWVHLNRKEMLSNLGLRSIKKTGKKIVWWDEAWSKSTMEKALDELSRITTSLEKKGFIIKKHFFNKLEQTSKVFFTLNTQLVEQIEQNPEQFLIEIDENVEQKSTEIDKKYGVYYKDNKINKENKINKANRLDKENTSSTEDNLEDASFDEDDLSFLK